MYWLLQTRILCFSFIELGSPFGFLIIFAPFPSADFSVILQRLCCPPVGSLSCVTPGHHATENTMPSSSWGVTMAVNLGKVCGILEDEERRHQEQNKRMNGFLRKMVIKKIKTLHLVKDQSSLDDVKFCPERVLIFVIKYS